MGNRSQETEKGTSDLFIWKVSQKSERVMRRQPRWSEGQVFRLGNATGRGSKKPGYWRGLTVDVKVGDGAAVSRVHGDLSPAHPLTRMQGVSQGLVRTEPKGAGQWSHSYL